MSKKKCPKCHNYMLPNYLTGKSECHHCGYNKDGKSKTSQVCGPCKYCKVLPEDVEYKFCEKHGELRRPDDKACLYFA